MIWQISAGQGPAECGLAVAKLATYLLIRYPHTKSKERFPGYHKDTSKPLKKISHGDDTPQSNGARRLPLFRKWNFTL